MPWPEGVAQCLIQPECPGDPEGWWFDPRAILARIARRFEALGLTPVVACEFEFYLLEGERAPDGAARPASPKRLGRDRAAPRVLNFGKLDDWGAILAEMNAAAMAQGLPDGAATAEYGGAPFVINLGHLPDPVKAADHVLMLRRAAPGVAQRHGPGATFLSKPFAGQSGSGLHIRLSLVGAKGRNAFDETRPGGEKRLGRAIAGLQATAWEAMAIFAPNLNAYRCFAPNQFVPVNTSWGRTAARSPSACSRAGPGRGGSSIASPGLRPIPIW